MSVTFVGRRVTSFDEVQKPGDYFGPTDEVDRDGNKTGKRGVWFLLPIAEPEDPFHHDHTSREAWLATQGNGMHRVSSPIWTFRECPDGSLEVTPSIGCGVTPYYFHGYLHASNMWEIL